MEIDSTGFLFLGDTLRVVGLVVALVGLSGIGYIVYDHQSQKKAYDTSSWLNIALAAIGIAGGVALYLLQPDLNLRFYGVIIVTGAVVGAYVSTLEARRKGENPDYVWDGLLYALVGGILGARIYYLLTLPATAVVGERSLEFYTQNPERIFFIWEGGLHIFGAVLGGVLGLFIFTRVQKVKFLVWLDVAAPALLIAQAIGRWANYINQELYGPPTDLPWGIYIEPIYRVAQYSTSEFFHPLFLYESLLNLLGFVLLMWLVRRYADWFRDGDAFLVYLMIYPFNRFLMEFLRFDAPMIGNLNVTQALSAAVLVTAGVTLFIRHRTPQTFAERRRSKSEKLAAQSPADDVELVETSDSASE